MQCDVMLSLQVTSAEGSSGIKARAALRLFHLTGCSCCVWVTLDECDRLLDMLIFILFYLSSFDNLGVQEGCVAQMRA